MNEQLSDEETKTIYLDSIDGFEFEKLCKKIFSNLNYGLVEHTSLVGDKGKDLVVHSEKGKILVECKHHLNGTIGRPVIQKLHSALITESAKKGIVIITGHFSNGAIEYANQVEPPIELIDKQVLYDYATRAGFKLIESFGEGQIYGFSIPSEESFINKMSINLEHNLISKPKRVENVIKIIKKNITLKPVYLLNYEINSIFSTSIGIVHKEIGTGKLFFNGVNGQILDENICEYLLNGRKEKFSTDNNKNVHIIPFKILSNQLRDIAIEYIIGKHTQFVRYVAGNNRRYTKKCIPKKNDISLYNQLQIFTLESDIHFELIGKKRFLSVTDNGTKDLFVNEDNISECEVCNKPLNKLGILCNDCGTISHNKRFFNFISHGFYCNKCGKSICRNCASYFSKLLLFKTILCNNCSQQEIGRTIKKFKPTGLGR